MKKAMFRLMLMFGLAFLAAAQYAAAQQPMLVKIPFAFTAGKTALAAGEYRVEKWTSNALVLSIRRTDLTTGLFVMSQPAEAAAPQTQYKLVFHCYGNRYFLSEVWSAGSAIGRRIANPEEEKEKALLARGETPVPVTIVAQLAH